MLRNGKKLQFNIENIKITVKYLRINRISSLNNP